MFVVEALLVISLLFLVLNALLPSRSPLAAGPDIARVREAVWARVNGTIDDPIVEVAPGVSVRSSSLRGFSLHGVTYYYYFEGRRGFDPLSRGAVDQRDVEVVLRDRGGPAPLVVYRVLGK